MDRLPLVTIRFFALFVAALLGFIAGPVAAQGTANINASVLPESSSPKPGTTTRIAIRMVPRTGWHGYWVNPGDSGLSVEANWTVPDGVTIGDLRHPAPTLLKLAGLASYVHKGAFTLLTDLNLNDDVAPGTAIPLRVNLSWLACSDTLCVPERATLDLLLTAGDGTTNAAAAPVFRAAEAALPVGGRLKLVVGRQGARDAMAAGDQRHRVPRQIGLLNDANLLLGRPAPTALHRGNDLYAVIRSGICITLP